MKRYLVFGIIIIIIGATFWFDSRTEKVAEMPPESPVEEVVEPEMEEEIVAPQNKLSTEVESVSWQVELANLDTTDSDDYKQYEQAVAINVNFTDGRTTTFDLGTAYGCNEGESEITMEGERKMYGKVTCYFAASGVDFIAFEEDKRFAVAKFTEDASGRTEGNLEVLLESKVR